jgi:hypothetical protein
MPKGAMTIAEGSQHQSFKTDATLILNGKDERGYILRTAYDRLSVWKTKYAKNIAPFYPRINKVTKEAAMIDDEIWIFGVDGTNSKHLIDSVTIATQFYRVRPDYFLTNIYIKNLNAEGEDHLDLDTLVRLNHDLYQKTVEAIRKTCEHYGITEKVKLHIYSANSNPKISRKVLHEAVKAGGAYEIETDSRRLNYRSGKNDHSLRGRIDTNLHVASINF